jgi:uncharacterized protein YaiI (UPF0178 family)
MDYISKGPTTDRSRISMGNIMNANAGPVSDSDTITYRAQQSVNKDGKTFDSSNVTRMYALRQISKEKRNV